MWRAEKREPHGRGADDGGDHPPWKRQRHRELRSASAPQRHAQKSDEIAVAASIVVELDAELIRLACHRVTAESIGIRAAAATRSAMVPSVFASRSNAPSPPISKAYRTKFRRTAGETGRGITSAGIERISESQAACCPAVHLAYLLGSLNRRTNEYHWMRSRRSRSSNSVNAGSFTATRSRAREQDAIVPSAQS